MSYEPYQRWASAANTPALFQLIFPWSFRLILNFCPSIDSGDFGRNKVETCRNRCSPVGARIKRGPKQYRRGALRQQPKMLRWLQLAGEEGAGNVVPRAGKLGKSTILVDPKNSPPWSLLSVLLQISDSSLSPDKAPGPRGSREGPSNVRCDGRESGNCGRFVIVCFLFFLCFSCVCVCVQTTNSDPNT